MDSPKETNGMAFVKKQHFRKRLWKVCLLFNGHNCNGWELKIVQFQTKGII